MTFLWWVSHQVFAVVYYVITILSSLIWATVFYYVCHEALRTFRWYVRRQEVNEAAVATGPRDRRETLGLSPLPVKE